MKLSEHFNREEFDCRDGTTVPYGLMKNLSVLIANLEVLRTRLGEPIRVNSGYRTVKYNKSIGGAPNSQHLLSKAADITVKSKTPKQLAAIIEKLISEGKMKQGGLGLYAGFIHYDTRGRKARW